jgi:hypothetical protein
MPQEHHNKAAELHEATAKTHRSASELHRKKDDKGALEHASKAKAQSDEAARASLTAHNKTAAILAKV